MHSIRAVPAYFAATVDNYLPEPMSWYNTDEGPKDICCLRGCQTGLCTESNAVEHHV